MRVELKEGEKKTVYVKGKSFDLENDGKIKPWILQELRNELGDGIPADIAQLQVFLPDTTGYSLSKLRQMMLKHYETYGTAPLYIELGDFGNQWQLSYGGGAKPVKSQSIGHILPPTIKLAKEKEEISLTIMLKSMGMLGTGAAEMIAQGSGGWKQMVARACHFRTKRFTGPVTETFEFPGNPSGR